MDEKQVMNPQSRSIARLRARMAERRDRMLDQGLSSVVAPNPCLVLLLIDCSRSMADGKLVYAQRGAVEFAENALRSNHSIGLISFDSSARLISGFTSQLETFREAVGQLSEGESTNMAAGIKLATQQLVACRATRSMVIFTDGMPDSQHDALREAAVAKALGIDIIAIGTEDADRSFLNMLASREDMVVSTATAQLGTAIGKAAQLLPAPVAGR